MLIWQNSLRVRYALSRNTRIKSTFVKPLISDRYLLHFLVILLAIWFLVILAIPSWWLACISIIEINKRAVFSFIKLCTWNCILLKFSYASLLIHFFNLFFQVQYVDRIITTGIRAFGGSRTCLFQSPILKSSPLVVTFHSRRWKWELSLFIRVSNQPWKKWSWRCFKLSLWWEEKTDTEQGS